MSASALNTILPAPATTPKIEAQSNPTLDKPTAQDAASNFMAATAEDTPVKTTEKTRNIINSLVQKSRGSSKNELTEIFGEDYEATANIPVLALLIDRLEQVTPESIPKVITENPFIQQSLANPIETVLQKEMSIAEIAEMIDLPPKVLTKAMQQGFSLDKKTTPLKFFKAIGIDPQKVIKGINRLRHKLTKDGIPHYVARAKAVQIQNFGKTFKKDNKEISDLEQSAHEISKAQNLINTPLSGSKTPNTPKEEAHVKKSPPIKLAQAIPQHHNQPEENLHHPQINQPHTSQKINSQHTLNHLQKMKKMSNNQNIKNPLKMMGAAHQSQQIQIPRKPVADHINPQEIEKKLQQALPQINDIQDQDLQKIHSNLTSIIKDQNKKSMVSLKENQTSSLFSDQINSIKKPEEIPTNLEERSLNIDHLTQQETDQFDTLSMNQNQLQISNPQQVKNTTDVPAPNVQNTPTKTSLYSDPMTAKKIRNTMEEPISEDHIFSQQKPSTDADLKKEISSVIKTAEIHKTLDTKDIENISEDKPREESSDNQSPQQNQKDSSTLQKSSPQLPLNFEDMANHIYEQESIDALPTQKAAHKILEKSQLLVEEGGGTIFIDLQEEMGNQEGIGLSVQIDGDDVRIKVVSQSEDLKEKISAGLPALQNKLNDHQMKLVSVDLGTESESQSQQDENPYENYNQDSSQNTPSDQQEKKIDWDNLETNLRPIQVKSMEKNLIQNLENRYMPRTSTIQIHT